jgi:hypothetical protein
MDLVAPATVTTEEDGKVWSNGGFSLGEAVEAGADI